MENLGEYTNWSGRKTFIEERDMAVSAVENNDTDVLKGYLEPLVLHWYGSFKKSDKNFNLTKEETLEAGFKYLETALEKYCERLESEKIGFKFSSYFEWFIRQGFLDCIKESGQ